MKVIPFNVPQTSPEAFRVQEDRLQHFYDQLHSHPEMQIMLILKSEGTLIVNDYVGRFGPGDLYVIGSYQAHVFRNDDLHYANRRREAHAISLYFTDEYMGEQFWNLNELEQVRTWKQKAANGLAVSGTTGKEVTRLLQTIPVLHGLDKLICFFNILKTLAESDESKPLSMIRGNHIRQENADKRMNNILQFTFSESHGKIYIKDVARIANLSEEAFCRYFKLHTQKTYTTFLNEVRVSSACKLLIQNVLSIQDICYQTGFSNLSNFNRVFKQVTGKTPSAYLAH